MYSVIINDKYLTNEEDFYNQLIFNFKNKNEAILFVNEIIKISDYSVEIVSKIEGE